MSRKSVREMGPVERWFHSLTVRSTIGVQLLALAVGAIVLFAGFMLYYKGIIYEYKVETSQMAKAESVMLDPEETRAKTDEILSIYDSIPDSEKGDGFSQEYLEKYASVPDEQFRDIQRRMLHMKEEVGLRNAFIAAISESDGRMIYLVDSDPKPESFCQPGTWDVYPVDEMRELAHGEQKSSLQGKYGLKKHPNAAITHTERFGTRCTGGAVLYETERYTVMVCLDEKLDNLKEISKVFLMQYVVLLLCVLLLIGVIAIILIRRTMVNPIDRMADAAQKYSEDKKNGNPATDHFRKLKIREGNEIEELNLTMADMEDSLSEYVENLTKATAEKERLSTELELAARIQSATLPTTFPAFPERDDFDIYATMTPAKEVGGDFYSFFLIDEDHLALTIADVSGKGIPAALFMMVSKIMLDNRLVEDRSPAKTLEQANNAICKGDIVEMFVTVWLGILELSTGKITAANAGHERPVIIHPDKEAEMIKDKHGFVVGGLEGMKYQDYELQLEPGAKLFLYTDGVPEATAADKEMFTTARMMDAADKLRTATPEETLVGIRNSVDEFVGDAEQFDDLTMLCVEYKGSST